jgi:hypothetical protein
MLRRRFLRIPRITTRSHHWRPQILKLRISRRCRCPRPRIKERLHLLAVGHARSPSFAGCRSGAYRPRRDDALGALITGSVVRL